MLRRALARPLVCLLVPIAVLYVWRLDSAPVYLYSTETMFALHAQSIATSARDLNGRFLPLYFQMRPIGDNVWFHPMLVYLTALPLSVLPLSEWSIRLPTVVVGLTDIVLVYAVATQIFKQGSSAVLAAVLLALTPAHFMTSRFAMDYLYPLPFVLGWLLCLLLFLESGRARLLFAATSLLGLGVYSYIAAVVMMPFYLLVTGVALLLERRLSVRQATVALAGFAWPLLPLVLWLATQPIFGDTAARYGSVPTLSDALHFYAITDRINVYWAFLNPSYLFVTGGVDVMDSTRRIGVFLLPLGPLLLAGLNHAVNARRNTITLLLVIGFFTAPLAAMIPAEAYAIDRELEVLPFAVLLAVLGAERLLSAPQRWSKVAAVVLLVLMPVQFAVFSHDYFGDYRLRSAGMYGGNLRGAIEEALNEDSRTPASAIYLSTAIPYVESYWKFYAMKERREDVLARTRYVDPTTFDWRGILPGALMVTLGIQLPLLGDIGIITPISELNGSIGFAVVRR